MPTGTPPSHLDPIHLFQVELPPDIHPLPDSVTPYVSPCRSSTTPHPPRSAVRLSVRARTTRPHPRGISAEDARHLRRTARGPPSGAQGRERTTAAGSAQAGRSRFRRQRNPARARARCSVRETPSRKSAGGREQWQRRCYGQPRGPTRKDDYCC